MNSVHILGLGLLLACTTEARNVTYCLAEDTNPYLAYATKTSYEYISNLPSSISSKVPYCKPVQIWGLLRHGTRFPGTPEINILKSLETLRDQVVSNHEQRLTGNLCDQDLAKIKAWTYDLDPSQSDLLAPQGYSDLLFIGRRMKAQFPEILNTTYSQDKFVFQHSDTERTLKSANSFAEGLFGSDVNVVIPDATTEEDLGLLRPYVNCSSWETKRRSLTDEKYLFEQTDIINKLVADVSKRLGFAYNLSMDKIENIYDMCRFNKAWNYTLQSPWCAAFSKEELLLLEYAEDLKYYYKSSYGNDMNLKLACPLLKDMYTKFSKAADNSSDGSNPVGTFYFSHASMLNMFNARLGMSKSSVPLTHSNYNTMSNRPYRTSFILPFASNIMAVFYKCTQGEENQVIFFHNEKVVSYEGCSVGLCSWKMIKEKFATVVDPSTCNVNFCKEGSGGSSMIRPMLWLMIGVVTVLVYRLL